MTGWSAAWARLRDGPERRRLGWPVRGRRRAARRRRSTSLPAPGNGRENAGRDGRCPVDVGPSEGAGRDAHRHLRNGVEGAGRGAYGAGKWPGPRRSPAGTGATAPNVPVGTPADTGFVANLAVARVDGRRERLRHRGGAPHGDSLPPLHVGPLAVVAARDQVVHAEPPRSERRQRQLGRHDDAHQLPPAVLGEDAVGDVHEARGPDHDDQVERDDRGGQRPEHDQHPAHELHERGERGRHDRQRDAQLLELAVRARDSVDHQLLPSVGEQHDTEDDSGDENRDIACGGGERSVQHVAGLRTLCSRCGAFGHRSANLHRPGADTADRRVRRPSRGRVRRAVAGPACRAERR